MNKSEIYIGTSVDWGELNATLNRSVSRLNQKLTKTLRTVAMQKGIKKTEQGQRLDLYSVSQEELNTLMKNETVRPLVKVDSQKLNEGLQKVNASYPSRMDYDTSKKYHKDLNEVLTSSLDVIGTDTNKRTKPTKQTWKNPYKVGDWVDTSNQYSYHATGISKAMQKMRKEHDELRILSDAARVYRVTDKSYWIEVPVLKEEPSGVSNWKWAAARFDNLIIAKGCNSEYFHDHDWTIPYEGNEDAMEFIKCKMPIRVSEFESKYPKTTEHQGYRSEYTERD